MGSLILHTLFMASPEVEKSLNEIKRIMSEYVPQNNTKDLKSKVCSETEKTRYSLRNFLIASCSMGNLAGVKCIYDTYDLSMVDMDDHSDDIYGRWSHPFVAAVSSGNYDCVKWLLENTTLDITAGNGVALYLAVKYESMKILRLLYETEKYDVNSCGYPDGNWAIDNTDNYYYLSAPFRCACVNGNLEAAKFLYETGKVDILSSIVGDDTCSDVIEDMRDNYTYYCDSNEKVSESNENSQIYTYYCDGENGEGRLDVEYMEMLKFLQTIPELSDSMEKELNRVALLDRKCGRISSIDR